jgi:hypothetical protein
MMVRNLLLVAALFAAPALAETKAAPPKPPADDPYWQQTVCRNDRETGSLVKARKTCHTRQQWAYIDDTNRSITERMMDDSRTKQSGN